jgi:cyclopropane fatty-acyl-phospholipid synthase-like methyltransferase
VHEVPASGWFNELAAFLGPAYLRNAFTLGTRQEVDFLVGRLGLEPGMRVLDAGCGPGRHALELAGRGIDVVGVDQSPEFVVLADAAASERGLDRASFAVGDVRDLGYDAEFHAAICL